MKTRLSPPTVKEILEFSTSPQNPKTDKILKTGIPNTLAQDFRVKTETGKGTATLPYITLCSLWLKHKHAELMLNILSVTKKN